MTVAATPTFGDSASVRDYLVEALRLDLIGPRPGDDALQHERLPHAPSRWYLTGFLAPTEAPEAQRAQDAEEELDEPSEPTQGGDDASAPERGSGKRVFLPSSMGLSVLADGSATRLRVVLAWGDYAPEVEAAEDAATAVSGQSGPSFHSESSLDSLTVFGHRGVGRENERNKWFEPIPASHGERMGGIDFAFRTHGAESEELLFVAGRVAEHLQSLEAQASRTHR